MFEPGIRACIKARTLRKEKRQANGKTSTDLRATFEDDKVQACLPWTSRHHPCSHLRYLLIHATFSFDHFAIRSSRGIVGHRYACHTFPAHHHRPSPVSMYMLPITDAQPVQLPAHDLLNSRDRTALRQSFYKTSLLFTRATSGDKLKPVGNGRRYPPLTSQLDARGPYPLLPLFSSFYVPWSNRWKLPRAVISSEANACAVYCISTDIRGCRTGDIEQRNAEHWTGTRYRAVQLDEVPTCHLVILSRCS
nr:hypothetical protein CFP56_37317 [Quercus suber]